MVSEYVEAASEPERIAAIHRLSKGHPTAPRSLVGYLIHRGSSLQTARDAFASWQERGFWRAADGTAWGQIKTERVARQGSRVGRRASGVEGRASDVKRRASRVWRRASGEEPTVS